MHLATAGTRAGLVALQLHCSVPGIPLAALEAAIRRALPARLRLLDSIEAAGKPVRPPVQRSTPCCSTATVLADLLQSVSLSL